MTNFLKTQKGLKKVLVSFLVSFKLLSVGLFYFLPEKAFQSPLTEQDIFVLHNQERKNYHFEPYRYSKELEHSAQKKAEDMLRKGYFSHDSPDGRSWKSWFKENNYNYIYAGENLAIDFSSAESVCQGWMNSLAHKKNILSSKFTEMGVGIASGQYQKNKVTTIVVVHFGKPIGSASTFDFSKNQAKISSTTWFEKFNTYSLRGYINIFYLLVASLTFGFLIFEVRNYLQTKDRLVLRTIPKTLSFFLFIVGMLLMF